MRAAWRRFARLAAGTAATIVGVIYAFVVLVDPWGSLPLTLPLNRTPVTSNQRFAYPVLARSTQFDSAIIGTSTSRLLRPADLNPAFGARFANMAMNSATPFEISSLLRVFIRRHPAAKAVILGIDTPWCFTGDGYAKLTPHPFPEWIYAENRWRGYAEVFNLYSVQEAGKEFGVLTGLKKPDTGRDGYTLFLPPDSQYDPVRAAAHMQDAEPLTPGGARTDEPEFWRYPAVELLAEDLAALPRGSRKLLFFPPYNYRLLPVEGSEGWRVWDECKRRVTAAASAVPNVTVADFMVRGPIAEKDDNYWDAMHYRTGVAITVENDLIAAEKGEKSADYRLLTDSSR